MTDPAQPTLAAPLSGLIERYSFQQNPKQWVVADPHGPFVFYAAHAKAVGDAVALLRRLRREYFVAAGEMTTWEACTAIDAYLNPTANR